MFYRGSVKLEIKMNFLIVGSVKQWKSLPCEVVGPPLLDWIVICLNGYEASCTVKRVELKDLQGLF